MRLKLWLAALAAFVFVLAGCRSVGDSSEPRPPRPSLEFDEPPLQPAYPDAELAIGEDEEAEAPGARAVGLARVARLPERPAVLAPMQVLPKLYVKGPTDGYKLTRTRIDFAPYPWAAFIRDNAPHARDLIQDVHIVCQGQSKWGIRDYLKDGDPNGDGVFDADEECVVERVIVENVETEHGDYSSLMRGRSVWRDCWYEECGAQGLQLRLTGNRGDPHWASPKEVVLERITAIECGQKKGAGRAGFAVSVKDQGPNATVTLRDIFVRTVNQSAVRTSGSLVYDSFGGVCVEYCASLDWRGGFVALKRPDRPAIQLFDYSNKASSRTGPAAIHLRGVRVARGGNIAVRLGDGDSIDIEGCEGNGRILVYTFDASTKVWRLDQNLSRPITQGMQWRRVAWRLLPGGRSSLAAAA